MRNAPPIVPGMPLRNSRPASACSRAVSATLRSGAPAPATTSWPSTAMPVKPRSRRITTPLMPPSRTRQVRADAEHRDRHVGRQCREERREILDVGRPEQHLGRAAGARTRSAAPAAHRPSAGRAAWAAGRSGEDGSPAPSCRRPWTVIVGDRARTGLLGRDLLELAGQRMRPGGDVAGAEADHDVARPRQPARSGRGSRPARRAPSRRDGRRARTRLDQHVAVDAFDRRLAGGIDIGDQHGVGIVEAGAEFARTGWRAGV